MDRYTATRRVREAQNAVQRTLRSQDRSEYLKAVKALERAVQARTRVRALELEERKR